MSATTSIHQLYRRLGPAGLGAIGAAAAALVVLAVSARGLVGALTVPSAKRVEAAEKETADKADAFKKSFEGQVAQFNGRSLFFVPGPPPPVAAKVPDSTEAKVVEKSKPSVYGGPSLIAMVNGAAWFDNGKKLTAGGDSDGDLKVVEIRAPWGALVEWQGVQFTIGLFDRDSTVYPSEKPVEKPVSAESPGHEEEVGPPIEAAAPQPSSPPADAPAPPGVASPQDDAKLQPPPRNPESL